MEETEMEMAQRHVAQAEGAIVKQRAIIDELGRDGHDTAMAIDLLATFEHTLKVARMHLARLA